MLRIPEIQLGSNSILEGPKPDGISGSLYCFNSDSLVTKKNTAPRGDEEKRIVPAAKESLMYFSISCPPVETNCTVYLIVEQPLKGDL